MNDKELELTDLDLEDILKEFGDVQDSESVTEETADETQEERMEEVPAQEQTEQPAVPGDTIRLDDLAQVNRPENTVKNAVVTAETVRLYPIMLEATEEASVAEEPAVEEPATEKTAEEEPAQMEEPEPPRAAPIVFDPRAKLRELKRKLVAGPERRYYELSEVGVGKLQMAMFLCLVVVAVSAGVGVMYNLDMIPENRMRLMVFGQVLAMLLGALMGSYQMLDGLASFLKGKFTANTLLCFTFLACCADSVFCLQELRVPICAAFTLEVMMSLWATYHQRTTEMGMMDTMRKAIRLHSVVKCPDFYEGQNAVLRGEGQVEDFMDHYQDTTGPEKVQNIYALVALIVSAAVAVAAGILHHAAGGHACQLLHCPDTAHGCAGAPAA